VTIARFFATLVLCAVVLPGLAAETTATRAARRVLADQQEAWNRADIDAFMKGYWKSEEIRFAGGDTFRHGWQATIDRYRKSYPDAAAMGKLDFDLVEVRELSKTVVYVFGKWHLTRANEAADKAPHGLFTLIVEKKGNDWFVTRDHTSAASN
jgi:ketosteroid isomerase-like protein